VLPTKDELPLHSATPDKKTRNTSEVAFIIGKVIEKNKTSINIQTLLIFIADGAPGKPIKKQNTKVLLVTAENAGKWRPSKSGSAFDWLDKTDSSM